MRQRGRTWPLAVSQTPADAYFPNQDPIGREWDTAEYELKPIQHGFREDPKEQPMMPARSITVAWTADIHPGELAALQAEGVRIAVASANGRFVAIDDTCTHEACSLADEGTLDGTVMTCGCHGAQFDVTTGAVLAPPAPEPVKVYPLRVEQGNVVVEV